MTLNCHELPEMAKWMAREMWKKASIVGYIHFWDSLTTTLSQNPSILENDSGPRMLFASSYTVRIHHKTKAGLDIGTFALLALFVFVCYLYYFFKVCDCPRHSWCICYRFLDSWWPLNMHDHRKHYFSILGNIIDHVNPLKLWKIPQSPPCGRRACLAGFFLHSRNTDPWDHL